MLPTWLLIINLIYYDGTQPCNHEAYKDKVVWMTIYYNGFTFLTLRFSRALFPFSKYPLLDYILWTPFFILYNRTILWFFQKLVNIWFKNYNLKTFITFQEKYNPKHQTPHFEANYSVHIDAFWIIFAELLINSSDYIIRTMSGQKQTPCC